ncbi:ABC transporter ATP-binding protein [Actinotalea sp. BY-33]|uniref:ABC transporter ATP-binding protein n=1 Tax=Actinotalea soli TaxID=2819234 RepID=A0A939RTV4_9CELL|nr:ABC transporter ATP-binding protein [Actinotalea soli]MBO1751794.1 ABC transporter ATP-binding protein [Actinotalea soli]
MSPEPSAPTPGPVLEAHGLSLGYGRAPIVHEVDLRVRPGALTVLVGANASGKSTLVRGLARLLNPQAGSVTLDGENLSRLPSREVARTIGVLPQTPVAPDGIRVGDLVAHGRYPHQSFFRGHRSDDDEVVAAALEATDAGSLVDRRVDELSGGQRQRVWIAMALAQQPEILLLDEPTSALDVAHQVEVLEVLRGEVSRGRTVVLVIHDLTLAARYADDLVVMAGGRIVARGEPVTTLTEEVVEHAFGVRARLLEDPDTGRPVVLPRSSRQPTDARGAQSRT